MAPQCPQDKLDLFGLVFKASRSVTLCPLPAYAYTDKTSAKADL